MASALRIGHGFDVHPFAEGRKLILGGVEIPSALGLLGHSDADALLHAITDAVLGALGRPDIGSLFPNTDERYKGAPSSLFLSEVWRDAAADGWTLVNCDSVILAEAPKLKPHMPAMRQAIAKIFGCEESLIGLKATTTEALGFVGRKEGLAASSVVLLSRE